MTSAQDVYAIGECANWKGNVYGLIGPGIQQADILCFNLTQTTSHSPRKMNAPDLSTKLKLMGVDVASFGEFDADERAQKAAEAEEAKQATSPTTSEGEVEISFKPSRKVPRSTRNDPVKALTYLDPIGMNYKKFIFSSDGTKLLGGILIGDTESFTKLVSIVKKKKKLDVSPSSFILGKKNDEDDSNDLADDDVICSCHGVTKGAVSKCVKDGMTELTQIKSCTKAGTGCGGCLPLVTNIFKAEMKKSGKEISSA
jgi:nitrite reductase (NAD(P)H)